MYEAIQAVLIVVGVLLLIKGALNITKGYNIGKILSMFINRDITKIKKEKRKS